MCSTVIFGANSHKYLAENYDHSLDHGLVEVNLKGTVKENGRQPGDKAIRWRVKYGSITFNQFSLELPVSGMNEKGLAVALMWHYEGDFGTDERYSRLSALQWIQYQLDNYQNITEVIEGLETVRPKQEGAPLHYSLLDAVGNSLLLEFLDGEPHLYVNPEFPILTNSSYRVCLEKAKAYEYQAGRSENSSIARFNHLYRQYPEFNQSDLSASAGFRLLQTVSQTPTSDQSFPWNAGDHGNTITAWSIVFSPLEKLIFLKTHGNESIREIRLADFDFEKESEYLLMNINDGTDGSAAPFFKPYTKEHNQNIVRRTAKAFQMPEPEQDNLINLVDWLYQHREMSLD